MAARGVVVKASVLFVGAAATMRRIVDATAQHHDVTASQDLQRGCALVYIGRFEAVVVTHTIGEPLAAIASNRGMDLVTIGDDTHVDDAARRIDAAVIATRARAVRRARESAFLARLSYRELLEHVRGRAVYEYLTALLAAHGGRVTEAAAAGRIERESFHRLLRRARISADDYRARDPENSE